MKKNKILVGDKWVLEANIKDVMAETLSALEVAKKLISEKCPDYDSVLRAAAVFLVASVGKEKLVATTIEQSTLPINDRLDFIEALHPDAATVLKNTLKTKTAANGSSGGKKRSAKYQALRSEIITAYLADPQAQAAKQIEHAKNILIKHNPELADRMGHRTIRDAISDYRKNIL